MNNQAVVSETEGWNYLAKVVPTNESLDAYFSVIEPVCAEDVSQLRPMFEARIAQNEEKRRLAEFHGGAYLSFVPYSAELEGALSKQDSINCVLDEYERSGNWLIIYRDVIAPDCELWRPGPNQTGMCPELRRAEQKSEPGTVFGNYYWLLGAIVLSLVIFAMLVAGIFLLKKLKKMMKKNG